MVPVKQPPKRAATKITDFKMEKEWVRIFDYTDEVRCEMARQILSDAGIEAVVINKRDRMYGFGEYELYVSRDNIILSKQILKELKP